MILKCNSSILSLLLEEIRKGIFFKHFDFSHHRILILIKELKSDKYCVFRMEKSYVTIVSDRNYHNEHTIMFITEHGKFFRGYF